MTKFMLSELSLGIFYIWYIISFILIVTAEVRCINLGRKTHNIFFLHLLFLQSCFLTSTNRCHVWERFFNWVSRNEGFLSAGSVLDFRSVLHQYPRTICNWRKKTVVAYSFGVELDFTSYWCQPQENPIAGHCHPEKMSLHLCHGSCGSGWSHRSKALFDVCIVLFAAFEWRVLFPRLSVQTFYANTKF